MALTNEESTKLNQTLEACTQVAATTEEILQAIEDGQGQYADIATAVSTHNNDTAAHGGVKGDVSDLQTRVSALEGVSPVTLSGDQTIGGTKTFSNTIEGTADKALKDGAGNTITSTYATKNEISGIPRFATSVVQTLPATGDAATVYLVPENSETGNMYTEYLFVNNNWEKLGTQTVQIPGVATIASDGLMSASDKYKLDGIASGANNYSHPTTAGNKHIPSGGSAGQILRWNADGTAEWDDESAGSGSPIAYGECSTEAATVQKEVTTAAVFSLEAGAAIIVRFTVTNTAANPTLKVNDTNAAAIKYRNASPTAANFAVNRTYLFVYDGTYYQLVGDFDTDTNTNTLVTQTVTSTSGSYYPVLLKNSTGTTTTTDSSRFSSNVSVDPGKGVIKAKNMFGTAVAVSDTSIDVSTGCCFTKTISAATTFTFTGATGCATFTLVLTNGGSKTVTWPSSVKWSSGTKPTLTSSGIDIISFFTPNGGTTWYGVPCLIKAS